LDVDLIREAIAGLEASALLQRTSDTPARYRYLAANAGLAAAVDELMNAYREQRTTIVSQMSANAIERIRSGSLISWADAFLIRRRKDDG
jgi:tagatose-1,6-bisphosphate aldolase non-catalytic subunit AgaZ/GatZ